MKKKNLKTKKIIRDQMKKKIKICPSPILKICSKLKLKKLIRNGPSLE